MSTTPATTSPPRATTRTRIDHGGPRFLERHPAVRYAFAVGVVALAVVAKLLTNAIGRQTPFLLFFAAIMLATWFGGRGGAIVAVVLSTVASDYFFLTPYYSLALTRPAAVELATFVLEACVLGVITVALKETRERADAAVNRSRAAEAQLRKSNRAHYALSSCNQALVRAEDEDSLMQEICRAIVEVAGYRMCWIGRAEHDAAKSVRAIAHAGYNAGYLQDAEITWSDVERGRGPTGTAIRTGRPWVQQNVTTNPAFAPWRSAAIERGYASSMAVPLRIDGEIFGALTIYASDSDAFDADELRLLTELASDLSYGVASLRNRARANASTRRLERIQIATSSAAHATSTEQVADIIARQLAVALSATSAGVFALSEDQRVLRLLAHSGSLTGSAKSICEIPIDHDSAVARSMRTGEVTIATSEADRGGLRVLSEDGGPIAVLLCAPMMVDRRAVGIVTAGFAAAHSFDVEDSTSALVIAHECGLALERARLFEAERRARADAEAERGGFESMLMAAPIAVAVYSGTDHVIRLVNPRWAALRRKSVQESLGKPLREAAPEALEQGFIAVLDDVYRTGESRVLTEQPFEVHERDGTTERRYYTAAFEPMRTPDRSATDIIVVTSDVTEEVAGRRALEAAREIAEQASRAKDEFLRIASHELRTPLTPLLAWAQILQRDAAHDPNTLAHGLNAIVNNARAEARLVDDVMDVSRMVAGRLVMEMHPLDMAPIVRECVEEVRPAAEAKRVSLSTSIRPDARLEGDKHWIHQMVSKLLSNALKFTPDGGRVFVGLVRDGDRVRLEVSDTGKGVAASQLPSLFDPFQVGDRSLTRAEGGLGLGLAIVRHVAEAHGGTARAFSGGSGRGATLVVELRAAPERDRGVTETAS